MDLREENRRLRAQLKELVEKARENEAKQARIRDLEQRLLCAPDLKSVFDTLLREFKAESNLDFVGLALVDDDHEVRRHLELAYGGGIPEELSFLMSYESDELRLARMYVGAFERARHVAWFEGVEGLAGVALLPLRRGDRLLGRLHLGTRDGTRYAPGVGTYFLERLAVVTAICLENAVNIQRLAQFGITDTLTGIRNRRYFDQRLIEEVQRARREQEPMACLFVDIDKFKRINDNFGHPVGDQVIREVARRISAQLRQFDVLARYGGEEFVVLLPHLEGVEALEIAERIRGLVAAEPVRFQDGDGLDVTVSVGLASVLPGAEDDVEVAAARLLKRADDALLAAKESGRNRVLTADSVLVEPSVISHSAV